MAQLSFGRRLLLVLGVFTLAALVVFPFLLGGWTPPNIGISLFIEGALLLILGGTYAFKVGEVGIERYYFWNPPTSDESQQRVHSSREEQQGTSLVFLVAGLVAFGMAVLWFILTPLLF